jgi:Contractile injection system tube protein/LysM domain
MELAKAYISEVDNPASRVTFHFNPTTITFSKSADFRREPQQAAPDAPPAQFRGTQPTELNLTLLLDAVGKPIGSVMPEVDRLLAWTNPARESVSSQSPSPPELQFTWGRLKIGSEDQFVGHLEKVDVTYQLFSRDGTPIRAEVRLQLKAISTAPGGTNPTSGGRTPHRTHALVEGDTLHSIAYAVYGDASAWRGVAEANGIDDPWRLRPGRELLLPARSELGRG